MEKLEIIEQFKMKYGEWLNPDLFSTKYCQSEFSASVELYFNNKSNPEIVDLKFMGGEIVENGDDIDILLLFNPQADIVDNARCLIELDPYSLIMCIDKIFTESAITKIIKEYS
jgi:hypothetical protein